MIAIQHYYYTMNTETRFELTPRYMFGIGGILMMLGGAIFFWYPQHMISMSGQEATDFAVELSSSLGMFMFAMGVINFLIRNSKDQVALDAVMIGTLVMLINTASTDIFLFAQGLFNPLVILTFMLRVAFLVIYTKMLIDQHPLEITRGNKREMTMQTEA